MEWVADQGTWDQLKEAPDPINMFVPDTEIDLTPQIGEGEREPSKFRDNHGEK